MGLNRPAWLEARQTIQTLLSADNPTLRDDKHLREKALVRQDEAQMHLPAQIGWYKCLINKEERDCFYQVITLIFTLQSITQPTWEQCSEARTMPSRKIGTVIWLNVIGIKNVYHFC
jgi:hypothetical protein